MKQLGFSSMQNKKKLNCSSGVTAERFVNTLNVIDPDDYSTYDDLEGMCEAIGYGPDDVGGWKEWFNTLDATQKREAWNYVSWAEEEDDEDDLDSSKKLNAAANRDLGYAKTVEALETLQAFVASVLESFIDDWEDDPMDALDSVMQDCAPNGAIVRMTKKVQQIASTAWDEQEELY